MGDVARCGGFFDLDLLGLRDAAAKVKWWHEIFPLSFAVFLGTAGTIASIFMISDQALLQVTETKKNILLTYTHAKPLGQRGFRLAACGKDLPENTGFTDREQHILCETAKDPDFPKFLAHSLEEQRWALSAFVAVFLIAVTFFWTFYREIVAARKMYARLACRDAGDNAEPCKV